MLRNIINGRADIYPVILTDTKRNSKLIFAYKLLGIDDRLIDLSSYLIPLWRENIDENKLVSVLLKYRYESIVEKLVSILNLYTDSIIESVKNSNTNLIDLTEIINQISMSYINTLTKEELVDILEIVIILSK